MNRFFLLYFTIFVLFSCNTSDKSCLRNCIQSEARSYIMPEIEQNIDLVGILEEIEKQLISENILKNNKKEGYLELINNIELLSYNQNVKTIESTSKKIFKKYNIFHIRIYNLGTVYYKCCAKCQCEVCKNYVKTLNEINLKGKVNEKSIYNLTLQFSDDSFKKFDNRAFELFLIILKSYEINEKSIPAPSESHAADGN